MLAPKHASCVITFFDFIPVGALLSCLQSSLTKHSYYTVDPTQSTTFVDSAPGAFNITYGDGSNILGDYMTDNLELSGGTIESLIMGLATSASGLVDVGIMGVGFDTNEASTTIYPNLIDEMVSQGLIDGRYFSLWLDDLGKSCSASSCPSQ